MLVRHFIGKRLAAYYAQGPDAVVGFVEQPRIPFSSLLGEWHWKRVYGRLYKENKGHWLTPVELFKPHFSNIIGDFVSDCFGDASGPVEIVELGGGRGTNAMLVMDYLLNNKPALYEQTTYRIIDSSPSLHSLQREQSASTEHASRISCELKDATNIAEGKEFVGESNIHTVLICLELLDNLPHDKIRVRHGKIIDEAHVELSAELGEDDASEVFVPMRDRLLSQVLLNAPVYKRGATTCWIPTVACGLLAAFLRERPNASMLLADFDYLPPPDRLEEDRIGHRLSTWAEGEPLITSMDSVDYECYLRAPPNCDILFPTNFSKLASFVKKIARHESRGTIEVQKQADFLMLHGKDEVAKTKSWLTGYTPLLHDFGNCSVLTMKGCTKRTSSSL